MAADYSDNMKIMLNGYNTTPTIGGEPDKPGTAKPVMAPKGYKQLSLQQRQDWNNFLDYLDQQGVGGSKDLDNRDTSLGMSYLNKFRKENPNTTVNADIIPFVQYEQQQLRRGNSYSNLTPTQLARVQSGLSPQYKSRPISDVDSWLGSLTSKEYY